MKLKLYIGEYKGEPVAIKEVPLENEEDIAYLGLLREIAIMAFCDSPNIAQLKAIYFDPDKLRIKIIQPRYFQDLNSVLFSQKPLQAKNQINIIFQLINAIIYIHSKDLIHLDLKPSNIMLKKKDLKEIVLIDFGISKIFKKDQSTYILGYTPNYCAPELITSNKVKINQSADIFSFGIILYEILTRSHPNYQKNLQLFQNNKSTGNYVLDNLIMDCVELDSTIRPTAIEVKSRLQQIYY